MKVRRTWSELALRVRPLVLIGVSLALADIANAGVTTYTYDVHGRLATVATPIGSDQVLATFNFDPANNRLSIVYLNQDFTAPNAPSGLSAAAQAFDRIRLTWTKSLDVGGGAISYYRVYRGTPATVVASPPAVPGAPTTQTYDDQPLAANTPYTYKLTAVDPAGNESAFSSPASATTPPGADLVPPDVPANVGANAMSGTWIKVTWTRSNDTGGSGLHGYEVFRSQVSGSTGTLIGSPLTESYDDTSATPATQYFYSVRAYDNWVPANYSALSGQATATTPDTVAPGLPGSPQYSAITGSTASVTWTDASDNVGVTGYQYRLTQGGNVGPWIDTSRPVTLSGLVISTTYTVEARARDAAGNWGNPSSNSFTTSAYYTDNMAYGGSITYDNNNMGTFTGFLRNTSFGTLSPNLVTPSKIIDDYHSYILLGFDAETWSWYVQQEYTALAISGFTSTPSASWLQSVSGPGGLTLTGASATGFSCSNGQCVWWWPIYSDFSGSTTLTIVHQ